MNAYNILVIGIGRVGLPLALVLADKGFNVLGVDLNPQHIALLQQKKMPFVEEGADLLLEKYYGTKFRALHESLLDGVIGEVSHIIITLGTPLNESYGPDLSQITSLFEKITPNLQKGQTIILRSTVSPGTTELIARRLEAKGLKVGEDIFLAYCPERIAQGKSVEELVQIPQIVGTIDKKSADKASEIFSKVTKVIHYSKPRAAELAKLFSNMYRYIDFAIGNEFMMIAEDHGCDIYEVLNLVNKDYKRGGLKSPGLTAGPCLVKDGFFLIDKSPYMELVTAAWRMNENVPGYLLSKIKRAYPDLHGKKVVILGMTFKKNIDDTRLSLAPKMARHFEAEGALVYTYDPYVAKGDLKKILKNADIVVLGVNHDEFEDITLSLLIDLSSDECLICDIWNLYGTGKLIYGKDLLAKKAKATLKQEGLSKLQSKVLVEKEKKSYSGLVS